MSRPCRISAGARPSLTPLPLTFAPIRKSHRWPTALLLANSLLISGCVEFAHRDGWFVNATNRLVVNEPPAPNLDRKAVVLRDPYANALTISSGPPRVDSLKTSILPVTRTIQITFHTELPLSNEAPTVYFPIESSPHVHLGSAAVLTSNKDITVVFNVDQLGYDLLLSTLFSPRGLQGVAAFSSAHLTMPLEGRAEQPWFIFASIWSNMNDKRSKRLLFRSEIEYPVILDTLSFQVGGKAVDVPIGKTLRPWRVLRIKLPMPWSDVDLSSTLLTKRIERKVPTVLRGGPSPAP